MADKKISQLTAATTPLAGSEVLPIVQSSTTVKVSVADVTKGRTIQTTGINDNNNNEVITITTTASAVNEITVANAATGANPVIAATGNDTNIGITLTPKGTGNAVLTTGNLVVANGNGIDFSATSGTGTSELLADYEEGTWEVVLTAATSGTITLLANNNTGAYTKIGNRVFCQALVQVDSVAAPTGLLGISLPFANAAGTEGSAYAHGSIAYFNVDLPAGTIDVSAEIVPSALVAYVKCSVDNGAWSRLDASAVAAGSYLAFSIVYFV